jgi:hypothetical protein
MNQGRIRRVRRCPLLEAKAEDLSRRNGRGCNARGVPWSRVLTSLRANATESLPCLPVSGDVCLSCRNSPHNPDLFSQPPHSAAFSSLRGGGDMDGAAYDAFVEASQRRRGVA